MAKNNKKCYTCGKEYYYCPSCTPNEPSYKIMHCSKVCNDVWNILAQNGTGKLSAQETIEALFHYELPYKLNDNVQAHIDRLVDEITTSVNDEPVIEKVDEPMIEVVDEDMSAIDDEDE